MVIVIDCYFTNGTVYEGIFHQNDELFLSSNSVFPLMIPERYGITHVSMISWEKSTGILRYDDYRIITEHDKGNSIKWFVFDDNQSICAVKTTGYVFFKFPKIQTFDEPEGWKILSQ